MAVSKDLVGKKLNPYSFTVERGKVKEFCRAIGETNPVFLDPAKAKEAGFEDTPIPPTFQTTFQFWGYPEIFSDMSQMGIDRQPGLLGIEADFDAALARAESAR